VASSIEEEVEKMRWATKWGADTVMDLSRERIFTRPRMDYSTVRSRSARWPIYQALEKVGGRAEELTLGKSTGDTLVEQAEQVSTISPCIAGVLCALFRSPRAKTGIVSRVDHLGQMCLPIIRTFCTPIGTRFARSWRPTMLRFAIGDGLRPGSIAERQR